MRRIFVVLSLVAFTLTAGAQSPAGSDAKSNAGAKSQTAVKAAGASNGTASLSPVVKDLPVRKVVLYKNGVGYFEHAGQVNGSQRVAIDFSSSQLNDVLQSLTVLDEGGGRVAAVNYNSTTPI